MRLWIQLTEKLAGPHLMDGWWIDQAGEIRDCDHRHNWHHQDIATEEFGESDEDVEEIALANGWVRASWYDKTITIDWRRPLKERTKKTLIKWMSEFGAAFAEFNISGTSQRMKEFDDAKTALRYILGSLENS